MGFRIWSLGVAATIVFSIELNSAPDTALDIPEQIHLSFGNSPQEIIVVWSTTGVVSGYVMYGKSGHGDTRVANSSIAMLSVEKQQSKQILHRAVMKNLTRGTKYSYRVFSEYGGEQMSSGVFNFTTIPDGHNWTTRFLVFGDLGAKAGVPTFPILEEEVATGKYHAVWHVGDFAYDLHSDAGSVGDDFMRKIEKTASQIPYMTSPGNHEIAVEANSDFIHYRTRFSMPDSKWPMPVDKLWYSYNVGLAHIISYSTEVYFTYNQDYVCEQYYWLLNDLILANQNRAERPWIIAMGHRPMYCSNDNSDDCTGKFTGYWVKYGLEKLFYIQGVDIIIEAHEHSYERLWPVYDGTVTMKSYNNPSAPVHIISGAAGNQEGADKMRQKGGPWSAFRADANINHTYGRMFIINDTHFYFEQISVKNKYILDSFWLEQKHHGSFIPLSTCDGESRHITCTCPPPFRYMTIAIISVTVTLLTLVVVIVLCCAYCYRKCKSRSRKVCYSKESQQKLLDFHNQPVNDEDISLLNLG